MKYMMTKIEILEDIQYSITTTENEIDYVSFPAEKGNPNYDAFLEQAKLTDKQVKELKPDVWYDFPEGDK